MSKTLKNAIAKLLVAGVSKDDLLKMFLQYASEQYVDHKMTDEQLETLVSQLEGWTIVDTKPGVHIIENAKRQRLSFGISTNNQLHVAQTDWQYQPGDYGPPCFATPALSIPDLVKKITDLEKRLRPTLIV